MKGHVRAAGKGKFVAVVSLGKNPETGRYEQKWSSRLETRREADEELAKMLGEYYAGTLVKSPAKTTLRHFLRDWLAHVESRVRGRTLLGYTGIVNRICEHLGYIPLADLTPVAIQQYYARLRRADGGPVPLAGRMKIHHHRVLSEALSWGVRLGVLSRNPCARVDAPRAENREIQALDSSSLARLLGASRDTEYYPLFVTAAHTGMRRGELLGLRWSDIDLEAKSLFVRRAMTVLRGRQIAFGPPKSAGSRRRITLTQETVLTLRAHRERQEAHAAEFEWDTPFGDALVFCHPDGSPRLPDSATHAFGRIARAAGLGNATFHVLRHTHASVLLQHGVPVRAASARLGHSSATLTLNTYGHLMPGAEEAAASAFEAAISGA